MEENIRRKTMKKRVWGVRKKGKKKGKIDRGVKRRDEKKERVNVKEREKGKFTKEWKRMKVRNKFDDEKKNRNRT